MAEKQEVIELNQPQKAFDYENGKVILSVRHLKQYFRFGRGQFKYTKAVHDGSFDIYKGETFSLVGESGSGKSLIAANTAALALKTGKVDVVYIFDSEGGTLVNVFKQH